MSQAEGPAPTIGVVIPALNEEATIADQVAEVLAVAEQPDLPARIERVVVVDNGSTDRTAPRAARPGRQSFPSRAGVWARLLRRCAGGR